MAKVLINIPDPLLKEVDRRAKRNHLSRSEATREAYRAWFRYSDYVAPKDRPGIGAIEARMKKARKLNWGSQSAEQQIRKERERQ